MAGVNRDASINQALITVDVMTDTPSIVTLKLVQVTAILSLKIITFRSFTLRLYHWGLNSVFKVVSFRC